MHKIVFTLFGIVVGIFSARLIWTNPLPSESHNTRSIEELNIDTHEQLLGMRDDISRIEQILNRLSINNTQNTHANISTPETDSQHNYKAEAILSAECTQQGKQGELIGTSQAEISNTPTPDDLAKFTALSEQVNEQLTLGTLTMPDILNDPEVQSLPQSMQQDLVSGILDRVNSKELGMHVIFPNEEQTH